MMSRKKAIKTLLFLFVFVSFSSYALGHTAHINCPAVKIIVPDRPLVPLETDEVRVEIAKPPADATLRYEWALSIGNVVSGQGTWRAQILVTKEHHGSNVTLSVKIKGLPPGCADEYKETVGVVQQFIGDPVDNFGDLKLDDIKARMDNFFIQINSDPHTEGVILMVFDRTESKEKHLRRVIRILSAINFRKYDMSRITFLIEKDTANTRTTLWIVPPGADLPGTSEKTTLIKGEDLIKNPRKALPK